VLRTFAATARRLVLALPLSATPLALGGCGPAVMPPSAASPLASRKLPDFKRRTIDGATIDTAGLRGKVVVVKFFAKYCEPCKRTLPAVEALAEQRADVAFVGVDEDESEADARAVIAEYKLSFPVVHDPGNVLSGRYRVSDLPVTFVGDSQGVVRWVGGTGQAEGDLAAAISVIH
jgi:thiol-disulfide isomerase/thioredoxin